jgi:hypothetical protein
VCTPHQKQILAGRAVRLAPAFAPFDRELVAKLKAAPARPASGGKGNGGEHGNGGGAGGDKSEGGFWRQILDPRVVAAAALTLSAFLGERIYWSQFGIDFSAFATTFDGISLFVKNLAWTLICLVALALLGIVLFLILDVAWHLYGNIYAMCRAFIRRVFFVFLLYVVRSVERRGYALQGLARSFLLRYVHNRFDLAETNRPLFLVTSIVFPVVFLKTVALALIDTVKYLLICLWSRSNKNAEELLPDLGEAISRFVVEQKKNLDARRDVVDDKMNNALKNEQAVSVRLDVILSELARDSLQLTLNILKRIRSSPRDLSALTRNVFCNVIPGIMDRPYQASAVILVFGAVCLSIRYYDASTMVDCAASASTGSAYICSDTAAVPASAGARTGRVQHGILWLAASFAQEHFVGDVYARHLRPNGLAPNAPIVTLIFKETPPRLQLDYRSQGLRRSGSRLVAQEAGRAVLHGITTEPMAYLGEIGPWTFLYRLGSEGEPFVAKSEDIASISYEPVLAFRRDEEEKKPAAASVVPNDELAKELVIWNSMVDVTLGRMKLELAKQSAQPAPGGDCLTCKNGSAALDAIAGDLGVIASALSKHSSDPEGQVAARLADIAQTLSKGVESLREAMIDRGDGRPGALLAQLNALTDEMRHVDRAVATSGSSIAASLGSRHRVGRPPHTVEYTTDVAAALGELGKTLDLLRTASRDGEGAMADKLQALSESTRSLTEAFRDVGARHEKVLTALTAATSDGLAALREPFSPGEDGQSGAVLARLDDLGERLRGIEAALPNAGAAGWSARSNRRLAAGSACGVRSRQRRRRRLSESRTRRRDRRARRRRAADSGAARRAGEADRRAGRLGREPEDVGLQGRRRRAVDYPRPSAERIHGAR